MSFYKDTLMFGYYIKNFNFDIKISYFKGTLIKHLEEHLLQGNMCRDDIMMYYTTVSIAFYDSHNK